MITHFKTLNTATLGRNRSQSGYTLLEISIVLVIIGLIVGGTMVGTSLIRSAELRSIMDEKEYYVSAFNQYRNRFEALPGDHSNVTSYFEQSRDCGGTSDSYTSVCNGDGDGWIENSFIAHGGASNNEGFYLWRHLFAAGLMGVRLTGQPTTPELFIPGVNMPSAKGTTGSWGVTSQGLVSSSLYVFLGAYYETLSITSVSGLIPTGVISANEMFSLDTKFDDGMPATGTMRTYYISQNCTLKADLSGLPTSSNIDAVYAAGPNDPNGTGDDVSCAVVFPNAMK